MSSSYDSFDETQKLPPIPGEEHGPDDPAETRQLPAIPPQPVDAWGETARMPPVTDGPPPGPYGHAGPGPQPGPYGAPQHGGMPQGGPAQHGFPGQGYPGPGAPGHGGPPAHGGGMPQGGGAGPEQAAGRPAGRLSGPLFRDEPAPDVGGPGAGQPQGAPVYGPSAASEATQQISMHDWPQAEQAGPGGFGSAAEGPEPIPAPGGFGPAAGAGPRESSMGEGWFAVPGDTPPNPLPSPSPAPAGPAGPGGTVAPAPAPGHAGGPGRAPEPSVPGGDATSGGGTRARGVGSYGGPPPAPQNPGGPQQGPAPATGVDTYGGSGAGSAHGAPAPAPAARAGAQPGSATGADAPGSAPTARIPFPGAADGAAAASAVSGASGVSGAATTGPSPRHGAPAAGTAAPAPSAAAAAPAPGTPGAAGAAGPGAPADPSAADSAPADPSAADSGRKKPKIAPNPRVGNPIRYPGLRPAACTTGLALLITVLGLVGRPVEAVAVLVLQGLTAAGWFRLNGMWPARQGIALAAFAGIATDAVILLAPAGVVWQVIVGALGVGVVAAFVLQLKQRLPKGELTQTLSVTAVSTALTVLAAAWLPARALHAAPDWSDSAAVTLGALAVVVALVVRIALLAVGRAAELPTEAVSLVVSLAAATGFGALLGAAALGTTAGAGALLGIAAGAGALLGHRVASYDYPSRFVHMTAGVALPLTCAVPLVYLAGWVLS